MFFDLTRCYDVDDFHLNQIATVQLSVDCHIEKCEVAMDLGQFKSDPDCPDMLWSQRSLLADDAALISRWAQRANGG